MKLVCGVARRTRRRYSQAEGRKEAPSALFHSGAAGYGNAIWCARKSPATILSCTMVGDNLGCPQALTAKPRRSGLVELAEAEEVARLRCGSPRAKACCRVFGAVAGRARSRAERSLARGYGFGKSPRLPKPSAPAGPGRARYYLCFFGGQCQTARDGYPRRRAARLSAALSELARHEQYLALEDKGGAMTWARVRGVGIAHMALAFNGGSREGAIDMARTQADRGNSQGAVREAVLRNHHGHWRRSQPPINRWTGCAGSPARRNSCRNAKTGTLSPHSGTICETTSASPFLSSNPTLPIPRHEAARPRCRLIHSRATPISEAPL